jgi:hypothetical protein
VTNFVHLYRVEAAMVGLPGRLRPQMDTDGHR